MVKLELRKGARVRYEPVHSDEWREGTLVRPSPNQEEWLVKNELGKFWVPVRRLSPAEDGSSS
ncbi:MAG: hypothetical protein ACR2G8_03170 [Candidatus Limnocylindria bacterium]|nr:hypothetical protein [Chloroflexota bacterium]MDQ3400909.1 hypothetical protein [Chloroflexota bacterium]